MQHIRNFIFGAVAAAATVVAIVVTHQGGSSPPPPPPKGGALVDDGMDCTSPYNCDPNHAGTQLWLPYINAYRKSNGLGALTEESSTHASMDAYAQLVDMQNNNYFSVADSQGQTVSTLLGMQFSGTSIKYSAGSEIFLKGCYGGNTVPEMLAVIEGNAAANAIVLNPNWNKFGAAMVPSNGGPGTALSRWGLVFAKISGE